MTPFQRLLQRVLEILGWEWRAHRALWIAVLLGVPAAAAVWGWTTDALAPRLLDAAILLECLFGLAALQETRSPGRFQTTPRKPMPS